VIRQAPESVSRRRRLGALVAAGAVIGLIGVGIDAAVAAAGGPAGLLYFTTYDPPALWRVPVSYRGGRPVFGRQQLVARLPGADGVVFDRAGEALVGGQGTGLVEAVDVHSGALRTVRAGGPDAFHLALSPDGATVYTSGLPGTLCALPADPLGPGTALAVRGDDRYITSIAFDEQGDAFYTTGVIPGQGNFGRIDLSTMTTTRTLDGLVAAHGMAFDPFSRSLFLFGGDTIYQVDPRDPVRVVSQLTVPGTQLDQGTADGDGHLLVASNFGQLVVVDLAPSGRLDQAGALSVVPLHPRLDDVAPLVGPGAAPSGVPWRPWAAVGLGTLAAAGLGAVVVPGERRGRLPAWDLRRRIG